MSLKQSLLANEVECAVPRKGHAGYRERPREFAGSAYQLAELKWVRQCPLRIWRRENDLTIFTAANVLNVATLTIQKWEHGAMRPNDASFGRMAAVITPAIAAQWDAWLAARPRWDNTP